MEERTRKARQAIQRLGDAQTFSELFSARLAVADIATPLSEAAYQVGAAP